MQRVLAILGPLDRDFAHGLSEAMTVQGHWRLEWFPYRQAAVRRLRRTAPSAILVYGGSAAVFGALEWFRGPLLNYSGMLSASPVPRVAWDDAVAGRLAAEHLLQRGCQHFAFCGYQAAAFSQGRWAGFAGALRSTGAEVANCILPGGPGPRRHLVERLAAWIGELPRGTGLFAANDPLACALCEAALACGRRVPEDLALIGADDDAFCHLAPVPLSSIIAPNRAIGRACIELVEDWLQGRPPPAETRVPPTGLRVRASSDGVAIADPRVASAVAWIRRHCGSPITVGDLVAALAVGRRTLELAFQRCLGHGPKAEIERQRLDRAQRLLADPSLKIEAIAARCGYRDRNRFSAAFARGVGLPPVAWRRERQSA